MIGARLRPGETVAERRRIHVLTAGFSSPNGRAFLMPLILHREALRAIGISIRIFTEYGAAVADCDVLVVDSKFHSPRWAKETNAVLEEYANFRERIGKVILADTLDSTGFDHARQLPYVTLYCKAQLLRSRHAYLQPFYGHRPYSDYYHRKSDVADDGAVWSEPIARESDLDKMTVGWNSALADYSWLGPYRMAAYQKIPMQALLKFPMSFYSPYASRSNPISCRIGTKYKSRAVAFQREEIERRLSGRIDVGKVARHRYVSELRKSKIALSPFGLGEITLRDFEIFLAGAALLKPDMSSIETWPDLYRDSETMVAHKWDLSDLDSKIDWLLSNDSSRRQIAMAGQEQYRKYLSGPQASVLFAEHFNGIVRKCEALAA
jgi:Glycosyl transferases group 1